MRQDVYGDSSLAVRQRKYNGPHFTDAREFFRTVMRSDALTNYTLGGTGALVSAVAFYTEQDLRGVTDDTNWTADTYKTILSVTGAGLVSMMVGPAGLAGTPTTTFEVTNDGVLTTIAVVANTTTQRAVLGPLVSGTATPGGIFSTAMQALQGMSTMSADKTTIFGATNVFETLPWSTLRLLGTPCLKFNQSLLVRMKSSESNSTTTNRERRSAVQYMVMA